MQKSEEQKKQTETTKFMNSRWFAFRSPTFKMQTQG